MNDKINIGVIGCASIAKRSVLPEIICNNNFNLSGVASRTGSKADEFATTFGTKPFSGYEKLLDQKEINAVYIPLPCGLHYEWINKALDRNLHVLTEKSLACTKDEAEELNNKARKKNLVLMESFQFRFHNQMGEISDIINNKSLGEIKFIRSSFCFPPFKDIDNIRYNNKLGGGALLDAGAYTIKVSAIILGDETEVIAAIAETDQIRNIDIGGGGLIVKKNGSAYSEISFGFNHFYQCNLEIVFSSGKLTANRIFTAPPGFNSELIIESEGNAKEVKHISDNHFKKLINHFHDLIIFPDKREDEYRQNLHQAELIQQFRNASRKINK